MKMRRAGLAYVNFGGKLRRDGNYATEYEEAGARAEVITKHPPKPAVGSKAKSR